VSSAHRHTFVKLAQDHGWTRGAELGVDKGILFGMLLRECPGLYLIGVDTFPDWVRSRRVFELAGKYRDRIELYQMTTNLASALVDPESLDFVFIDADHSRAAVAEDIKRWAPKVRPGGWVGGHDYSQKWPGVIAAVWDSFRPRDIKLYDGTIWGVWKP
jgi:predicted O-methyltransferase YrrM